MTCYKTNPNRKVYNIDFDGTLTILKNEVYLEWPEPNPEVIEKVKQLSRTGNIVIIWTARWWSQASVVAAWLIKHEIPFHGLMMGKGGSDCYIDDKALNVLDFINK